MKTTPVYHGVPFRQCVETRKLVGSNNIILHLAEVVGPIKHTWSNYKQIHSLGHIKEDDCWRFQKFKMKSPRNKHADFKDWRLEHRDNPETWKYQNPNRFQKEFKKKKNNANARLLSRKFQNMQYFLNEKLCMNDVKCSTLRIQGPWNSSNMISLQV